MNRWLKKTAVLMLPFLLVGLIACTGGGGSADLSSQNPAQPIEAPETSEKITAQEIAEMWKSIPSEYAMDSEELSLIESEILSRESKDLGKPELAKLIESEKGRQKAGGN